MNDELDFQISASSANQKDIQNQEKKVDPGQKEWGKVIAATNYSENRVNCREKKLNAAKINCSEN